MHTGRSRTAIMSIKTNKLTHTYNPGTPFEHLALDGITLNIPQGKVTAIIGQTGSGKSTFVQHLNALLIPTSGSVDIENYHIEAGTKIKDVKELRKKWGSYFSFRNISFSKKRSKRISHLDRKILEVPKRKPANL